MLKTALKEFFKWSDWGTEGGGLPHGKVQLLARDSTSIVCGQLCSAQGCQMWSQGYQTLALGHFYPVFIPGFVFHQSHTPVTENLSFSYRRNRRQRC